MKKSWRIILLIGLIVLAIGITRHIVKANANSSTDSDTGSDSSTDSQTGTKMLGSATTTPFPANTKLYANTASLNVRKAAGTSGEILKVVTAGTFIGTTTGTELVNDTTTWVEVKLSDNSKAYVSKNYTYILV